MYFEDIFKKVKSVWDRDIYIGDFNNDAIVYNQLSKYYENSVENSCKNEQGPLKYWCELINWSIYVVLSEESKKLVKEEYEYININRIPIELFEKRFKKDLKADSWEEERKQYKGFKNPSSPDILSKKR